MRKFDRPCGLASTNGGSSSLPKSSIDFGIAAADLGFIKILKACDFRPLEQHVGRMQISPQPLRRRLAGLEQVKRLLQMSGQRPYIHRPDFPSMADAVKACLYKHGQSEIRTRG